MGFLIRDNKVKFNGGLVSKNTASRNDLLKVQFGCEKLDNLFPLVSGGVTARAGFRLAKTISGGLSGVTAYTSSTPIGKLHRFAFDTEDTDTAAGYGDVYLLAFLWNYSGTPAANLLIYNPDGTQQGDTITADSDGDTLPWTDASIPNLRIAQKGDVVYIVDSLSRVMKLERTGSPSNYTFTVKKVQFSDDPFDPSSLDNIQYEVRQLTSNAGAFLPGNTEPDDAERMSKAFLESVPILDSGEHNDFVINSKISAARYFVSYSSNGNHGQTKYEYQESHNTIGYRWKGQFFVENDGKYTFGINSHKSSDLYVDGKLCANKYTGAAQFADYSEYYGGTIQTSQSIVLFSGLHDMVCRHVHGAADPSQFGVTTSWRMEADTDDLKGVDRSNAPTEEDALTLNSRGWFGRMPYRVKITITSATKYKWEYQRITSVYGNTFGAWEPGGSNLDISAATSLDLVGDLDIVDEAAGSDPLYEVPKNGQTLATITLDFNGTPTTNEYWLFNIGYERIPLSIFENSDPLITTTKYPYTVTFHDSRLGFGGNDNYKFRLNFSNVALYQNFQLGPNADEAISTDALGARYDKITWMIPLNKLLVGTVGAVHAFPIKNEPFSPENSRGKVLEYQSNAFVQPAVTGNIIFGVNSSSSGIYALAFTELDGFSFTSISKIIENKFSTDKIKEVEFGSGTLFSYSREEMNVLFVLTEAGKLKCYCFNTEEEFSAWSEHPIGGDTSTSSLNTVIHSIVALPTTDGDRLYALVNRNSLGLTLEYLDPDMFADHAVKVWDDDNQDASFDGGFINLEGVTELAFSSAPSGYWTAWYVRSGVVYWLVQSNGLSYAEVDGDGSSESALLLHSDTADYSPEAGDKVYVGLYFEPAITPMTHDIKTQRGDTSGMLKSWNDPFIKVINTNGKITVERKANSSRSFGLKSGNIQVAHYLDSDFDNVLEIPFSIIGTDKTGQLTFRRKTPTPFTLLELGGNIEYDT